MKEKFCAARYVLNHPLRGPERDSTISDHSAHSQRIERFGRDVCSGVIKLYQEIYQHEHVPLFAPSSELDLLCLHSVFVPKFNMHLDIWKENWINH